jgi:endoglucanase
MVLDRRHFTLASLLLVTGACSVGSSSSARTADTWWQRYRDAFLAPDGRVVDTGNGGISHSEGQGYGMALALAAGDRDAFVRMAEWTERTLARPDMALYSWRYDPRAASPIADPNNATDGDMLIAWALGRAGQQWGRRDYLDRAAAIRSAIRRECVVERFGRQLLLPGRAGFAEAGRVVLNPSYFIWWALDGFAKLDGASAWRGLIADCEDIVRLAKFGPHRLPTDWVEMRGPRLLTPAADRPPRFGFDAIRVALYASMGGRQSLATDIAKFWRSCHDRQRAVPAWIDVMTGEEAPYPLSNGGAAIAAPYLHVPAPAALSGDYFAASLQMLARARTVS